MRLPRLYAILDAGTLASCGIPLEGYARELARAGVTLVQYRDKQGSREEILANARRIAETFRDVPATLVMNDSPELAVEAGWRAVHVGQGDAAVAEARRVLGPGGLVGCSTHNEAQVIDADAAGADYIAVGPVFATSTKADHEPVIGLEGVRRARALTRRPLVAIGGITRQNAADVLRAGADCVAVIGALVGPGESTEERVREFLAKLPG
jgi:thiamine-phosphate pyrophosphorylase